MKKRKGIILIIATVMTIAYLWYSSLKKTFTVENVSESESFQLFNENKNSRTLNIDLKIKGNIDNKFRIHIISIPSNMIVFDSVFSNKSIDYFCKVDFYSGNGAEIVYTPEKVTKGELKIIANINSDF